jgi:hypothetical protein
MFSVLRMEASPATMSTPVVSSVKVHAHTTAVPPPSQREGARVAWTTTGWLRNREKSPERMRMGTTEVRVTLKGQDLATS